MYIGLGKCTPKEYQTALTHIRPEERRNRSMWEGNKGTEQG